MSSAAPPVQSVAAAAAHTAAHLARKGTFSPGFLGQPTRHLPRKLRPFYKK